MSTKENKGSKPKNEKYSLLEALQIVVRLSLKNEQYYSKLAKIVSVDDSEALCEVSFFDDEPNLTGVKIQQIKSSGFYVKPSVDSIVIISFTDPTNAFVSLTSQIDEIVFQDGSNDGLVKVNDLVTKLNNLESEVNKITNLLKTWTVVPNDGGLALKTTAIGLFTTPLTPTVKADLENTNFKH